jgi:hypothetical protein
VSYVIWLGVTGCWLGAVWTDAATTHQHWVNSAWVILVMGVLGAFFVGGGSTEEEDE